MKRATGLLVIEVRDSNPNGDPDRESDPRQRADGRGEISPVSLKRKLRDLVEDKQCVVWETLAKELELSSDEFQILESRDVKRAEVKKLLEGDQALFEQFKKTYWHRQQHIFLSGYYWVEYGLAQIGAVQIWVNARDDQKKAVADYRKALALGATVPLPDLFAAAGAKFAFDAQTLKVAVVLIEQVIGEMEAKL